MGWRLFPQSKMNCSRVHSQCQHYGWNKNTKTTVHTYRRIAYHTWQGKVQMNKKKKKENQLSSFYNIITYALLPLHISLYGIIPQNLSESQDQYWEKKGKLSSDQQQSPLVVRHLNSDVFSSYTSWLLSQVIYDSLCFCTSLSITVSTNIGHCFYIAYALLLQVKRMFIFLLQFTLQCSKTARSVYLKSHHIHPKRIQKALHLICTVSR